MIVKPTAQNSVFQFTPKDQRDDDSLDFLEDF